MEVEQIEGRKWFWGMMMPLGWVVAGALTFVSQDRVAQGFVVSDRAQQSLIFLAVFAALAGLMGTRVLLTQALAEHHVRQATLITVFSLVVSVGLIAYGVSTID